MKSADQGAAASPTAPHTAAPSSVTATTVSPQARQADWRRGCQWDALCWFLDCGGALGDEILARPPWTLQRSRVRCQEVD